MPAAVQTTFEFVSPDERIRKRELKTLLERERMALRAIAKPLGVNHHLILSLAKKYRLKKRKRHIAKFFTKEIVAAKLAGKSAEEIAASIGCSRRRVHAVIREFCHSEISEAIGSDGSQSPELVKPWKCERHGLVKFRPCVACLAEGRSSDNGTN